MKYPQLVLILLTTLCAGVFSDAARAVMMLTTEGIARGFTLSTFATGFPTFSGVGPLGIAFPGGGKVLVSDHTGRVRVFPTGADGQNAATVTPSASFGNGNATGIAQVGSRIFMAQQSLGRVVELNADGTFKQVIVTGLPSVTGLTTRPGTGKLFASVVGTSPRKIVEIDPVAKSFSTFRSGQTWDGLSFSADGSILYGAVLAGSSSRLQGYRLSDNTQVFDVLAPFIDGTAVGAGVLNGFIFGNTNDGKMIEIDLSTATTKIIASGGSRGDFVTVDPSNNSLLLTQTDRILRLTAPSGGGFGGTVPEPPTAWLLALGMLFAVRRHLTCTTSLG